MPRCAGSKPDSTPCERIVGASQKYCFAHDPDRAFERSRNASRAARSRPNRQLVEIRRALDVLHAGVLTEKVSPKVGAVVVQIINSKLRLCEMERRIRETEEIERRIINLEAIASGAKEARRYHG